jgi:undecaprenyl phosphate-alpha-L-ara4FN deformylase
MTNPRVALKIDVDTYRGIEDGAARLASFLHSKQIPASFFVSLGPDHSGRAAMRVFRQRGFWKKMRRTSAVSVYGWRTVLSGTLLPARPMGTSFRETFRQWREMGFEVSPHGFDHILWHDEAASWDEGRADQELQQVADTYRFIFGEEPQSFAAPGWQAGWGTWRAMEKLNLLYHSDTRGTHPYFASPGPSRPPPQTGRARLSCGGSPQQSEGWGEAPLKTLEIPTTLPTWDEMLTWDGIDRNNLVEETLKRLRSDRLNVWTIHAEFEGAAYYSSFREAVEQLVPGGVEWVFLPDLARDLRANPSQVPNDSIVQRTLPGRAGTVTCQHG